MGIQPKSLPHSPTSGPDISRQSTTPERAFRPCHVPKYLDPQECSLNRTSKIFFFYITQQEKDSVGLNDSISHFLLDPPFQAICYFWGPRDCARISYVGRCSLTVSRPCLVPRYSPYPRACLRRLPADSEPPDRLFGLQNTGH